MNLHLQAGAGCLEHAWCACLLHHRAGLRVRVTGYMDWDNYTVVVKEPIRVRLGVVGESGQEQQKICIGPSLWTSPVNVFQLLPGSILLLSADLYGVPDAL